MVQLCACLSHDIAGAGAASTGPILWALMQGKGQAGQPCNNIAPQLSGAPVRAAMELNGLTRMQKMCLNESLKRYSRYGCGSPWGQGESRPAMPHQ